MNVCRGFAFKSQKKNEQLEKEPPEVFCKKVFLKVLQNSHENTCARVFFLIKFQVFLWILRNFKEHLLL